MKRFLLVCVATLGLLQNAFAQEEKKFEFGGGASYGIGLSKGQPNSYGFDLFGGSQFTPNFTVGLGINYTNYFGRTDLPSGDENLYILTGQYHAFGAKFGYAFFSDTIYNYGWVERTPGLHYGNVPAEYEHILTDPPKTLGIGNNFFGTLDLGVSRRIGNRGNRLSLGVSLDFQPMKFNYNNSTVKKFTPTVGPFAKLNF